jgi:hypothetical protein
MGMVCEDGCLFLVSQHAWWVGSNLHCFWFPLFEIGLKDILILFRAGPNVFEGRMAYLGQMSGFFLWVMGPLGSQVGDAWVDRPARYCAW